MQDDDEAFEAFERTVRARSVLDVEQERMSRGYSTDVALLKHGGDLEDEILRMLEREGEILRESHQKAAEMLNFPTAKKPDGA
jgi:hypothetical protein